MGRPGAEALHGRLERARRLLAGERLDALLVGDLLNVRYLCGFTGSNGLLVVLPGEALLITDSRYTLQAREEARGCRVVEAADLDREAARLLDGLGAAYVGAQASGVSAARWERLRRLLRGMDLIDLGAGVDALRAVKDPGELGLLREAARLAERCLGAVLPLVRPGVPEAEVATAFHLEAVRRGAEGPAFDTIVAGGPQGALPHARPGPRRFREGDLVVMDFGVRHRGYCSDETVTVPVGEPGEEARKVYRTVLEAQQAALGVLRAGVRLAEVDRAARDVIAAAGYGERFGHGTGHGVGLAVHELPTVNARSGHVAEAGMVVTVEPGVYLPGRFGVRLEDTVVITDTGYEPVTRAPKGWGEVLGWDPEG